MATRSEIRSWIGGYDRDFNQLCQALMWQLANKFGTVRTTPPSAISAYRTERDSGRIHGGTPPAGSFVYWDIGADGHVGYMLDNGDIFMGTTRLASEWGDNAGINTLSGYGNATGARYLGWSYQNGGNTVPFSGGSSTAGTGSGVDYAYGLSPDAQKAMQGALTRLKLYTGKVDGIFGEMSVKAMQQYLKNKGLLPGDYNVDGVPGEKYGAALQTLAKGFGYTGAVDGIPGTLTSNALIKWAASITGTGSTGSGDSGSYAYGLTTEAQKAIQGALAKLKLYTGKVDGVFGPLSVSAMQQYLKNVKLLPADYGVDGEPGENYGLALQKLAAKYGYTGAMDGVPGTATSAALVKWAASVMGSTPTTPTPTPETGSKWPTTGTFGIDVASPQRDLDFAKAKAAGAKFVIVKMGGLNVKPQYVAPHYVNQVDKARAAGLKVGHYYLIGLGQTPEQQAAYFVDNLHDFRVDQDVLALDNEKLDDNGVRWNDPEATRFVKEVIRLTGIDPKRVWHYSSASDYRSHAPWPGLEAAGVRYWWAAYNSNDGTLPASGAPSLQGSIPRYDVHQFSSVTAVAGYNLDGDWSPHAVDVLFAKGAVTTNPDPDPEPEPEPTDKLAELLAKLKALVEDYS